MMILCIVLVGFTSEQVPGEIEVENVPLVYVWHGERWQYYWTKGVNPYTVPLRLGSGEYEVQYYQQDDYGVYRLDKRLNIRSDYEPTYLENTYDCFEFPEVQINLDSTIETVKVYCDTMPEWKCEERAKFLAYTLRKNNILCKVIIGQVYTDKSIRHAWNEVYYNGEWNTVDISLDGVKVRIKGWEE